MKRSVLVVATLAALLALPAAALAQEQRFRATLSADEEVPAPTVPSDYDGTGMALVTLNEDRTELSYEVEFSGLTGPLTMAHIHWLPEGEPSGPPMLWLTDQTNMTGTPSPLSGTLTEADFTPLENGPQTFAEAIEAIEAGDTYVNLHTADNPPGEIRGRLTAVPPDTATSDGAPGVAPWALVLAVLGAAMLVPVARRFAARRA